MIVNILLNTFLLPYL